MFEQFSRGYYLGRLYVEPQDHQLAALCREQYEQIATQLYAEERGATPEQPLVMKLGTRHFRVHGEDGVPADTLAVPPEIIEDDARIRNPPALREVFLAKADRAEQLLEMEQSLPDQTGI
ncbi:DUF5802 family protein [Halapricum hydrolyticum]|uniref:DUF5802 family protein n=1 Tax=Halapricum hydrolyticum TaxID=2979991 RepID=A0AAE3IE18_9EURY|nr:DUF5802 family protein [Halapricum hydrolyticum]MCU4717701.1 DUF5802 family protein [Halapricum hydrolyticum]MCU4726770.1 DUF5802 family protein [Halapricum hydrolyticum]